jgi:FtsH-binding integral membrane protein
MANWNDPQSGRTAFGASPSLNGDVLSGGVTFDAGLRKHMLSIYNYMASGVLLTGIVALLFARSGMTQAMIGSPLMWVVMLAPLAFIFTMNYNRSAAALKTMFWAFCAVMGLSMSTIFLVYTGTSIAGTFFATAGAFAGLSLYGYTTQRSLSGLGSFLIMGVVGLIVASIVNYALIYFGNPVPGLTWAISFLGVGIFAGLTAYDTQRLKDQYAHLRGTEFAGKAVILGALSLYLDFINMFQFLLSFLGSRD